MPEQSTFSLCFLLIQYYDMRLTAFAVRAGFLRGALLISGIPHNFQGYLTTLLQQCQQQYEKNFRYQPIYKKVFCFAGNGSSKSGTEVGDGCGR